MHNSLVQIEGTCASLFIPDVERAIKIFEIHKLVALISGTMLVKNTNLVPPCTWAYAAEINV